MAESAEKVHPNLASALIAVPDKQLEAYRATRTDDFVTPEQIHQQVALLPDDLPEPCGYRVMLLALTMPEEVGGLVMIEESREAKAMASPQGVVLALGIDAYGEDRYPNGPWCQVGDRVCFTKYAGRGYKLHNGLQLFFLNDDEVIAKIDTGYYGG